MRDVVFFLKFLYSLIGHRFWFWLFVAAWAGVCEGVGVALFLPILEGGDPSGEFAEIITAAFELFGLEYSFLTLLVVMVVFFLLRGALFVFQDLYFRKIVSRLFVDLRSDFMSSFFRVDYQYFLGRDIGSITNAATVEFQRMLVSFGLCGSLIISAGFMMVYFSLPLSLDPYLTLSVVVILAPGYFVVRWINRLTQEYSVKNSANNSHLQSFLIQAFQNFKYLKATNSSVGIREKIHRASRVQGRLYYKQSVVMSLSANSVEPLCVLAIAGIFFYQVQIRGGVILEILFVVFLLRRAISFFLATQLYYRKLLKNTGSIRVFRKFKEELAEHQEDSEGHAGAPDFDQPIRLKDVSFRYRNGPYVLKNINLDILPKRTVALVGASGGGKSTLATLLTGMLKPSDGEIFVGDQSYDEIDHTLLRGRTGYVTQESVIFNDTIRNNITLWGENSDKEKVREAAVGAHIQKFIESLPDGYDAVLGDNGINISGGQRQRISIARELFKDVKLLIFDEATSSLDGHSEREIQRNIDEFRGEKTIILIAHRLSTVKNSDLIFVLKDGEIVEQGSYDELYDLNGEFRTMVQQQQVVSEEGRGGRSNP